MQEVTLSPVTSPAQVDALAALAEDIWREHFPPIIGDAQVTYMLDRFQSAPAISRQLSHEGYRYYFLEADGQVVGYTGVRPDGDSLFLSKLYIQKPARGNGYASAAVRTMVDWCREKGWRKIWLTVNRHNDTTIAIYRKLGFVTVREEAADIGNGFVMDDYIMEKPIDMAKN